MGREERDPGTYAVIGAAREVHGLLGAGFLEAVYQEALSLKMKARGIPFAREADLPAFYKGHQLQTAYRADLICFDTVLVEIKALRQLGGAEEAQVINYLKATSYEVGLLLNFGTRSLEHRRFALSKPDSLSNSRSVPQ